MDDPMGDGMPVRSIRNTRRNAAYDASPSILAVRIPEFIKEIQYSVNIDVCKFDFQFTDGRVFTLCIHKNLFVGTGIYLKVLEALDTYITRHNDHDDAKREVITKYLVKLFKLQVTDIHKVTDIHEVVDNIRQLYLIFYSSKFSNDVVNKFLYFNEVLTVSIDVASELSRYMSATTASRKPVKAIKVESEIDKLLGMFGKVNLDGQSKTAKPKVRSYDNGKDFAAIYFPRMKNFLSETRIDSSPIQSVNNNEKAFSKYGVDFLIDCKILDIMIKSIVDGTKRVNEVGSQFHPGVWATFTSRVGEVSPLFYAISGNIKDRKSVV